MNYLRFPFGKYKGYELHEIPLSYIVYALENMDLPEDLNNQLKDVLIQELSLEDCNNLNIRPAYLHMCKKYHPDAGGTDYAMQIINEFYNIMK